MQYRHYKCRSRMILVANEDQLGVLNPKYNYDKYEQTNSRIVLGSTLGSIAAILLGAVVAVVAIIKK